VELRQQMAHFMRGSIHKIFFITLLLVFHSLASSLAQTSVISNWKVQSSSKTSNNVSKLSSANLDTSKWHVIGSRGTLMATLLENKIYTDTDLFYSTNLQNVDYSQFQVPWYFRSEIQLFPTNGSFFQLKTNGISSSADIYFNGKQIASNDVQAGAYVGLTYDVTGQVVAGKNVLLVKVYPTDYNRDFALGFVDWNPYPPDNGTGIWRDVEIKQTGPVSMSLPRVVTKMDGRVSVRADVQNLGAESVRGQVVCTVLDPQGKEIGKPHADFHLNPGGRQSVSLDMKITKPQIWWPKQWGSQPLYSTHCLATTSTGPSDTTPPLKFGIRTVTSSLNVHNDTTFFVNNHAFQVLGAGYTSDIFLRFSPTKLRTQFQYVLDMGLNTIRLEGKQEHPYLYELASEMGLMIMAGWECCDKWEGWTYNDEGSGGVWKDSDYAIANKSMRHEAEMMQHHPSMLAFLVGSDFWPDDRATKIYVDALRAFDWDVPIIASASQRGFPAELGNGGMKMDGPYEWVPPNYWSSDQLGGAFGFGSELGAGVGTPELGSLTKFLSRDDRQDLWKEPDKGLYHMSTNVSSFYMRSIYNDALWHRYGAPSSLDDYLLKAQMMDYEATRAQFEGYAMRWNAERPATGVVYWMLNNAWPSLHWNLFDYYLHPAGAYFGTKVAARREHVAYDYVGRSVWVINRSRDQGGLRVVEMEMVALDGKVIDREVVDVRTVPNTSVISGVVKAWDKVKKEHGDVVLLRLVLKGKKGNVLSRNVYWLPPILDTLDWDNSTWYHTPVTSYANFTALESMEMVELSVTPESGSVVLENKSRVPAVFVRLNLVDEMGEDVVPVLWEENYVTLWPGEKMKVGVTYEAAVGKVMVRVDGRNVVGRTVSMKN
jgi:exo-1,4-beta-D-glucosaminidase